MKNRGRLIDSSDSEIERLLLRAGHERAPRGAKRRALSAATGVLAASALSTGHATGAAIAGKAAAGAKASALLSLKWIVVAGVASVGVVAGTVAVRVRHTEPSVADRAEPAVAAPAARSHTSAHASAPPRVTLPGPVAPPAPVASAAVLPAPTAAPPPVVTSPVVAPPAVATLPSVAPARRSAAVAEPSRSAGSTSATEFAMLDQARRAIGDGDAARGLEILDGYRGRFPRGVLGPEASVLRIEALVKAGDRTSAKREADAFLRASPTSPYAARVESLVGASNP